MTFRLPSISYRCIVCGDCCREPWALRIDNGAVSRLESIDWSAHRESLPPGSEIELFRDGRLLCYRERGDRRVLPRRPDACVFLETGNTCFLHRRFGPDTKPDACVEFPFSFVETPDGVYAGLSFVCREVRDGVRRGAETGASAASGETPGAFGEMQEAWRRSTKEPGRSRRLPDEIRLQEGFPLTWEEYTVLEEGLDRILGLEDRAWNDRLVAGEVFLGMLADYLRATASVEDGRSRKEVIGHYTGRMTSEGVNRLFRIADRIRPNRRVRRMVTGLFRAFAGTPGGKAPGRLDQVRTAGRWVMELVRPRGCADRATSLDDTESRIMTAYLRHVVWRKGLLAGASPYFSGVVRRGYAHLLITAAFVLQERAARLDSMPPIEATLEAVRAVERDFVLHGSERREESVQELINRSTMPLQLLDSVTHRKYFARSMVG